MKILKTEAYNYLSDEVKEFIKNHYLKKLVNYIKQKKIILVVKLILNPNYIAYLETDNKEEFTIVPSVTTYVPKLSAVNDNLPTTYDLRNVNGKNYLTPVKNQGSEGLCWAFASRVSILVDHMTWQEKIKSYDSTAVFIFSKNSRIT